MLPPPLGVSVSGQIVLHPVAEVCVRSKDHERADRHPPPMQQHDGTDRQAARVPPGPLPEGRRCQGHEPRGPGNVDVPEFPSQERGQLAHGHKDEELPPCVGEKEAPEASWREHKHLRARQARHAHPAVSAVRWRQERGARPDCGRTRAGKTKYTRAHSSGIMRSPTDSRCHALPGRRTCLAMLNDGQLRPCSVALVS